MQLAGLAMSVLAPPPVPPDVDALIREARRRARRRRAGMLVVAIGLGAAAFWFWHHDGGGGSGKAAGQGHPSSPASKTAHPVRSRAPLAIAPGRQAGVVAWSPGGDRIAWSVTPFDQGGAVPASQIWIANRDGTNAKPLIKGLEDEAVELIWPGPDELLFDENFQVYRAGTDGTNRLVLPDVGSSFTADATGTTVASSCDRCEGPIHIGLLASGTQTGIEPGKTGSFSSPVLSPDGQRVVFVRASYNAATGQGTDEGFWIANVNGTHIHRLVAKHGSCASWSPDGSLIAYLAPHGAQLGFDLISPRGGAPRQLPPVRPGPQCSLPQGFAWSPDSKTIAYVQNGWGRLELLTVANGRSRIVARFPSVIGVGWSPDSRRLLVTARTDAYHCASLWEIDATGVNAHEIAACRP